MQRTPHECPPHGPNRLAFAQRDLEDRGLESGETRLVMVHDDSMALTLLRGDTVLVDIAIRQIQDDGVYCIRISGHAIIRRLQHSVRGGVWLISDARQYIDEYVAADEAAGLEIVGQAVWIGREFGSAPTLR